MANIGKRIQTTPLIIHDTREVTRLKRIPLNERIFQEEWLQQLINDYPDMLPVDEIEPIFSPLVMIGKEVATKAGNIDNLLISPQGYLTIIETKLWRNPEARREVVGQIIDYAKEINTWTFDDLNTVAKEYNKKYSDKEVGIIDSLKKLEDIDEEQEIEIIDAINRQIQRGRFLLLIVGDGIRESVEAMAEFLSQTPHLHFTLALLELKIYDFEGGKLVIPQIVMRTKEITRAVIRVEGVKVSSISVGLDLESELSSKKRITLTEQDFFEVLNNSKLVTDEEIDFAKKIMHDLEDLGCVIDWKTSSFVIKLPDPTGSGKLLTLLAINKYGELYIGWLPDQLERIGLPKDIGENYFDKINYLMSSPEPNHNRPNIWKLHRIMGIYTDLKELIEAVINKIIQVADEL